MNEIPSGSSGRPVVFLTGANGFVGSHIARALITKGMQVRALVRRNSDRSRLEGVDVAWIEGDLDDTQALREGVRGARWVIHNAGRVRAHSREAYLHANHIGTVKLLDAVEESAPGIARFVYVSSLAAGGPIESDSPRTETDADSPLTPYGESKLAGENAVMDRKARLPVVALRPPAIYGPGDTAVLGFFQAVGWHIKPLFGPQPQRMSIVHAQDLVQAIVLVSEHPQARGEMFYIAEDRVYELSELEELIRLALDTWAVTINIPRPLLHSIAWTCDMAGRAFGFVPRLNRDKARDFVQRDWTCSTAKAQQVLGYHSRVPFADGARATVKWYREKGWL